MRRAINILFAVLVLSACWSDGQGFAAAHARFGQAGMVFDIPAQSLRSALDAFARTSGVNVTYDPALIEGRMSSAVRLSGAPSTALGALLAGSGLQSLFTNAASATIVPIRRDLDLPAATLAAQSGSDLVLAPLVVAAPRRIGGDDHFRTYAEVMRRELQAGLAAHPDLRAERFDLDVGVSLDRDGRVILAATSTGDGVGDVEARVIAFTRGFRFSIAPPPGMPQPVRLRMRGRNRR